MSDALVVDEDVEDGEVGSDDAPTFAPLSNTRLLAATASLVESYLKSFADASSHIGDEVGFTPELPTIEPDGLEEYLQQCITVTTRPDYPTTELFVDVMIHEQVSILGRAILDLDITLRDFLRGTSSVVSASTTYVNEPYSMAALEDLGPVPHGQIMLVPIPNFYEEPPMEDDPRTDCLMGVVWFRGVYLCRPALVTFDAIQDRMIVADKEVTKLIKPNVEYAPRFGPH